MIFKDHRPKIILPVYELDLPQTGSVKMHWEGQDLRCYGPLLAQHKVTKAFYECYLFESRDPTLDLPRVDGWCLLPGCLCIAAGRDLIVAG